MKHKLSLVLSLGLAITFAGIRINNLRNKKSEYIRATNSRSEKIDLLRLFQSVRNMWFVYRNRNFAAKDISVNTMTYFIDIFL